jgi:hypothetical protein
LGHPPSPSAGAATLRITGSRLRAMSRRTRG